MNIRFKKIVGIIIIVFALLGIYASFVLTIETIDSLKLGANAVASCDFSAKVSCSTVMKTPQAEIFGFPNSLLGIAGYAMVLVGGCILYFYNESNKKFNLLLNIGVFGAFLFSYWLIYQSAFNIGVLCPYCILSCFSATNIFFAMTLLNLKENNLNFKEKVNNSIQNFITRQYYIYVIGAWYLLVFGLVYWEIIQR